VVADRWFPSSTTCSACGAVKPKLPLAVRTYRCEQCDLVIDRDVNAAANLAARGEAATGHPAPRLTSRAGDRHPGGPSAQNAEHACAGSNEPVTTTAGAPVEAGTSRPRPRAAQALDCPGQGQLPDVGGASHLTSRKGL
jgi:putative transposase